MRVPVSPNHVNGHKTEGLAMWIWTEHMVLINDVPDNNLTPPVRSVLILSNGLALSFAQDATTVLKQIETAELQQRN